MVCNFDKGLEFHLYTPNNLALPEAMDSARSTGPCLKQWTLPEAVDSARSSGLCLKQWTLPEAVDSARSSGTCL